MFPFCVGLFLMDSAPVETGNEWRSQGQLAQALSSDLLVGLYEAWLAWMELSGGWNMDSECTKHVGTRWQNECFQMFSVYLG